MNEHLKEIGKRLREARIAKKLSQEEVAFKTNTSPNIISNMELGKSNFRIETFLSVIEVLQVSADYILRADVPTVKGIYNKDVAELLEDCSPQETEQLLRLMKEIKSTYHH